MIEYQRLGGIASSGGVEKQGAGPKRLPQKSPETNRAWAGSISIGEYEKHVAGGAANDYDHIELSGFPDFAKRSQADAFGKRGILFRSTRASSSGAKGRGSRNEKQPRLRGVVEKPIDPGGHRVGCACLIVLIFRLPRPIR
jgi:hypothetical protein